jgi:hypothetical protein
VLLRNVHRFSQDCNVLYARREKSSVTGLCNVLGRILNPGHLVEVTLRLTASQSVCLGVEPTLGLVNRYYFLSEGCCLKVAALFLCSALSDERTGLLFEVQSLSGPSRAEPGPPG